MCPQSWGLLNGSVTMRFQVFNQAFLCHDACLLESINLLSYFQMDITMFVHDVVGVLLVNHLFWSIFDVDSNVLEVVHGVFEVVVTDVNYHVVGPSVSILNDTVEVYFGIK